MRTVGVIMAGGQSRRMGLSKVLLPHSATDSTPIWLHVARTVAPLCDEIVVVTQPQIGYDHVDTVGTLDDTMAAEVPNVRIVRDDEAFQGPLQALAGAWSRAVPPEVDTVFLLAADLPGLERAVVETLWDELLRYPDADGAVVMRKGRQQPLLGCYRATIGVVLQRHAQSGDHRLLPAFSGLRLIEIDERDRNWPMWWTRPVHTSADYAEWLKVSQLHR